MNLVLVLSKNFNRFVWQKVNASTSFQVKYVFVVGSRAVCPEKLLTLSAVLPANEILTARRIYLIIEIRDDDQIITSPNHLTNGNDLPEQCVTSADSPSFNLSFGDCGADFIVSI